MQWFYWDAHRQQHQTDEANLRQLLVEGVVKTDTLVWNETMTEWQPLSTALPTLKTGGQDRATEEVHALPRSSAGAAPSLPLTGSAASVRTFATILAQHTGWMRFLGGLFIFIGIALCLTVVGGLIGWIPIWQGRLLLRAARLASEVQASGSSLGLTEALESISTFFKLMAVCTLLLLLLLLGAGGVAVSLFLPLSLRN